MDQTEISNNEYRQFVYWVRDSIAREKLYRRQEGDSSDKWVNKPDNFFKEPYRTMMDMGSDVQGGNKPFELFMDSLNNAKVDQTYLKMMGSKDTKVKNNKLVNGYKSSFTRGEKDKIEPTLPDKELGAIYSVYSGTSNKNPNGGRVENRKYFTLNWTEEIEYDDPTIAFLLSDMYYSSSESYYKEKK